MSRPFDHRGLRGPEPEPGAERLVPPSRREALTAGLVASAFPAVARADDADVVEVVKEPKAAAPHKPYLSPREFATLEALAEVIIPADEHSPGAKEAKVAAEIDRRLAEAPPRLPEGAALRKTFRDGLRAVDALAKKEHGKTFLDLDPAAQDAVVGVMAAGEGKPTTPVERFFVDLKNLVTKAYYTTEIGLLQDLGYKGNVYLQEFEGTDAALVDIRKPADRVR